MDSATEGSVDEPEPKHNLSEFRPDPHAFVDCGRLWFRNPLTKSELAWLRERCGGRKMYVHTRRARFDYQFVQRVTAFQPTTEALEWLARRNDILLNYVEIAFDWIFSSEDDKQEAFTFVCEHLVKRYHRDQGIRFAGEDGFTRYTGPRGAPNLIAVYADLPSKVTGEVECLHFDWRISGVASLRRAGIRSVRDLLHLDHGAFWRERLVLCEINRRMLGRRHNNHALSTRRRRPWIVRCGRHFAYDMDLRAGSIIHRACGSTQGVVDRCRQHFPLTGCLVPIDIGAVFPSVEDVITHTTSKYTS